MNKQLPKEIHDWLSARKISDSVLDHYGISFSNNRIVIPVRDVHGNFLFNKYRRNPNSSEGPKYLYDKGSTSVLYGMNGIFTWTNFIICEGELDALCLASHRLNAVSSTGGAGTFSESWAEYFNGVDTYICYDNDDAGIKGAFNVQSILPHAKIIWLPKGIKDVTDYFVKLKKTREDFILLMENAKMYELPKDWRKAETKKDLKKFEKEYAEKADALLPEIRELKSRYESADHLEILKLMYLNSLAEVKRKIKYFDKPKDFGGDRIAQAKKVPIPQFINFNGQGFGKCLWHNDSKPSMYYYEKQNRVKCFSCGKLADVIDTVMQLRSVPLPDALKILLNQ